MIFFLSYLSSSIVYRNADVPIKVNENFSVAAPVNNSNLFNSMIYPFTRMVIYGSIWYQGKPREL